MKLSARTHVNRSPDGGTEIEFTTVMEPSGPVGLLAPLMRPWAAGKLRRFMIDVRRWAEVQLRPAGGPGDDRVVTASVTSR